MDPFGTDHDAPAGPSELWAAVYGDGTPRPAHTYAPAKDPWWQRAVAPLLVILVIGGIAGVLLRNSSRDTDARPEKWDQRVAQIAEFVSTTRDLEWAHPIYVEFMAEDDFVALFDVPETASTLADISDYLDAAERRQSLVYDALGLAVDYDASAGASTVSAVTTLGFYSLDNDRVYVRGETLNPALRVVLAHELTHALQAQHFELNVEGPNDLQLRAIVEADALRVENVYRDTLSAAEQQQADAGNTLTDEGEANLGDVPWPIIEERYAPYVLGPNLVGDVFANGGNRAVDQLISTPPREEILLNPWLFGSTAAIPTVSLQPPVGSIPIDPVQQLSPLKMLIVLDAWLPFTQARAALEEWGAGSFASYQTDEAVCFAVKVTFDESAARFAQAVTDWAAAAGSDAVPTLKADTVEFEACERGQDAAAPPDPLITPLFALTLEHDAIGLAGDDPSPAQILGYRCFAAMLIDDPIAGPLLTLEQLDAEQDARFTERTNAAARTCGVPPLDR